MKKQLLVFSLLSLFLVSCDNNTTSSSLSSNSTTTTTTITTTTTDTTTTTTTTSEVDNIKEIQNKIDELKNDNYSITYFSGTALTTPYKIYKNSNYFFDSFNDTGYVLMKDGTTYEFGVYDDMAFLKMPYIGMEEVFKENFQTISFDLASVGTKVKDGVYSITNTAVVESFAHATNTSIYYNGSVYLDEVLVSLDSENNLYFELNTIYDNMSIKGTFYDVNNTSFKPIADFLALDQYPEFITSDDKTLANLFGEGDFSCLMTVTDYANNVKFQTLLGNGYYFDPNSLEGAVVLKDDKTHLFTYKNNVLNVDFDYAVSKEEYEELFSLGRVDYSKFTKVSDTKFISRDYFNVQSFANYFSVLDTLSDTVIIDITGEDSIYVEFYDGNSLEAKATVTDINNASLQAVDDYLKTGNMPKLPSNPNTEDLVAAFKDIKSFNVECDDNFMTSLTVTEDGRYEEYDLPIGRDRSYVKKDDKYYGFLKNGNTYEINYSNVLTADEYKDQYTFENIDFSTFYLLAGSNPRYYTSSTNYIEVFTNILNIPGSSIISAIYITLNEDGSILLELKDDSLLGGGETTPYTLTNINTAVSQDVTNATSLVDPSILGQTHQDYLTFFEDLAEYQNFRVHFHSGEGDNYTDEDDDFYTKDVYYSGYYKDGLMKGESGYFYEFREEYIDDDGNTVPFTINSHPTDIYSIFERSYLGQFAQGALNNFIAADDGSIYTQDYQYIADLCSFIYMSDAYVERASFKLNDTKDEMDVIFYSRDYNFDAEVVNEFTYEEYARVTIKDVNKTSIPSDAVLPEVLR